MDMSDTIVALATGIGKSAIAIIRVSGPQCQNILRIVCKRDRWTRRTAIYTQIYDLDGALIDKAIVLLFEGPHSFTGEDMVEFQITGGRGVKSTLLRSLLATPKTRAAEPGEFTRRAFKNGKIDLVQAEGLAAVVDAETQAEVRHSALMAFGNVSHECERARAELLQAASLLEGLLDFSDIEDPENSSLTSVQGHLVQAKTILDNLKIRAHVSERLRAGFTVAIVGKPNAGKSTLINNLLGRDAALVSEVAGTTRDYLEFFVEFSGFPIVLIDTAGFRAAADPVEKMGIAKSKERILAVDLVVWLDEFDHTENEFIPSDVAVIKVRSKSDLSASDDIQLDAISISTRTGHGIDYLFGQIVQRASSFFENYSGPGLGSERQVEAVAQAIDSIKRALQGENLPEELIAEEIRAALTSVGRVTGRVDVEDVLDEVFARLCVGK